MKLKFTMHHKIQKNGLDQMNSYETQIYYASQNTKKWSPMKQNMTSPKYTTNWYDLPKVN